jgi:hypothetical protein
MLPEIRNNFRAYRAIRVSHLEICTRAHDVRGRIRQTDSLAIRISGAFLFVRDILEECILTPNESH